MKPRDPIQKRTILPCSRRVHYGTITSLLTLGTMLLIAAPTSAATWSPQFPTPKVKTSFSELHSVSCITPTACMAAGLYGGEVEAEPYTAYAELWNGSEWISQSLPQPKASIDAIANGTSCPTVEFCMVVGIYIEEKTEVRLPFAEQWNGTKWTLQPLPIAENTIYADPESISCTSATECVAVGLYTKEKGTSQPYIVKWNGTKWMRQIASLPTGGAGGQFFGISCVSSSNCTAVGNFYSLDIVEKEGKEVEVEVPEGSLVDTWNGSKWLGADIGGEALSGVSCPSVESCMAVSSSGTAWVLSGTKWGEIEAPPLGEKASSVYLEEASCVSAKDCTVVGEYVGETFPLYISVWDGKEWDLQTSIEPSNTEEGYLSGVSCPETKVCIAVGEYLPFEGQAKSIAEHSK